ncbi:MAG: SseB family protein, partial [Candidatus Nanopelagicales bacterium]
LPPVSHSIPDLAFQGDDGSASQTLVDALSQFAANRTAESGTLVLLSLAQSRVLVPVVAILEEVEPPKPSTGSQQLGGHLPREKLSSMAAVLIEQPNGDRAMLAFTCLQSLQNWRGDARPVPISAVNAASAALADGATALLIDTAGPIPFAVTGDELTQLSQAFALGSDTHRRRLHEAMAHALNHLTGLLDARLVEISPSARLLLVLDDELDADQYRALMSQVTALLADDPQLKQLLPHGLAVVVVAPDADVGDTPSLLHPG